MSEQAAIQTISSTRNLVVIQRNPTSGSGRGRREVWSLLRRLQAQGFETRVYHHRQRCSRFVDQPHVAARLRCLVAAGGDGTISSLVQRHPQHPIAVLPLGTENLVAKHLGLRCKGHQLADVIQDGHFLSFDTGLADSHRFLLMASVGLDAEVVRLLTQARQGNINHFSYLKPIFSAFRRYQFPLLHITDAQGEHLASGTHVLVSNMPEYGMKIPFCPDADPHDGLLDIRVYRHRGSLRTAMHLFRTKLGVRDCPTDVIRLKTAALMVESSDETVPLQADGDPCGTGSVSFRIADEKMKLLVPRDFALRRSEAQEAAKVAADRNST